MKYNKSMTSRVQYSRRVNRNNLPVEKWTLIGTVEKDLREGLDLDGALIWTVEKKRREGCCIFSYL